MQNLSFCVNFFFLGLMKSVRDWVFSQLLASSRQLSGNGNFFHGGPTDEEFDDQGITSLLLILTILIFICLSVEGYRFLLEG